MSPKNTSKKNLEIDYAYNHAANLAQTLAERENEIHALYLQLNRSETLVCDLSAALELAVSMLEDL